MKAISNIPQVSLEGMKRAKEQSAYSDLWKGLTAMWFMPFGRGAALAIPSMRLDDTSGQGNHGVVEHVRL